MAALGKPSQQFVPIKEIRNGAVILKDGGLRMVLLASSVNFALKSQDEQTATLSQFQNFLNTLDFTVQFYVQSRRLDIHPYIALLEERRASQVNDLMKTQIDEYIRFIRAFTEANNIMTKTFLVVVPYEPAVMQKRRSSLLGKISPGSPSKASNEATNFEENITQLEQRVAIVQQGLSAAGISAQPLDTEVLVETFYKVFNPAEMSAPAGFSAARL